MTTPEAEIRYAELDPFSILHQFGKDNQSVLGNNGLIWTKAASEGGYAGPDGKLKPELQVDYDTHIAPFLEQIRGAARAMMGTVPEDIRQPFLDSLESFDLWDYFAELLRDPVFYSLAMVDDQLRGMLRSRINIPTRERVPIDLPERRVIGLPNKPHIGPVCYMSWAYVHPSLEGRGVMTELYNLAERQLSRFRFLDTPVVEGDPRFDPKIACDMHPRQSTYAQMREFVEKRGFELQGNFLPDDIEKQPTLRDLEVWARPVTITSPLEAENTLLG